MTAPAAGEGVSIDLSRKQAVRLVRRWVSEQRPAALVRMGEGEGRLLAADPSDEVSVRVAVRKLRRQTGLTFSVEEMLKVRALVMRALDEADVLGLGVSANFADEHREWGERIAAIYSERVARGRKPAHLTHCLLNSDLYEALPVLLREQKQVSVVSCRNLAAVLRDSYGVPDVAVHQIPSQYVVRDVDGEYEAALHDVPIWPEFYERLEAEIAVRNPGEIFLVGAGLFGKGLCIRIRDLGGIALDMGSTLDKMARKVTRGRNRPTFRDPPEVPRVV